MVATNGNGVSEIRQLRRRRLELAVNAMQMAVNEFTLRREALNRTMDPRRDVRVECGHPSVSELTAERYQELYDSDPLAARVVEYFPDYCWRVHPYVYELEDAETVTPFEEGWDGLGQSVSGGRSWHKQEEGSVLWDIFREVDILSGIGRYGILLHGFNDGLDLSLPVKGVEEAYSVPGQKRGEASYPGLYSLNFNAAKDKGHGLLYLRALAESQATISRWETNRSSPRYGHPVMYSVAVDSQGDSYGMSSGTVNVHWTRVTHVADGTGIFAIPRMQQVIPRILDLQKIYGADAEAYWKNAFLKLFLESDPARGGDVDYDKEDMRSAVEQMMNGSQQWMALNGFSAKAIPPAVADLGPHIDKHIQAICIQKRVPQRIFMGSERGQLASSQDEKDWNKTVMGRQTGHCTHRIVAACADRWIMVGVLPEPKESYCVDWPEMDFMTAAEKATVFATRMTALAQYVGGNVEQIMTPMYMYTNEAGYSEEEATVMIEDAAAAQEEKQEEQQELAAVQGQQVPPGQEEEPEEEEEDAELVEDFE